MIAQLQLFPEQASMAAGKVDALFFFLLAVTGVWLFARRDWPYLLLILPAIYFTALHVVFVSSIRYRQPAMLPLIVLAVWIGLYPTPFLTRLNTSVLHVMSRINPQYAAKMAADCGAPAAPPTAAAAAENPGLKFLATVPCDPQGRPLTGSKGTGADIPPGDPR